MPSLDLFNADALAETIAFRGGTAIHKLLFARPLRYSEDIDLVQTKAGPIGKTVDAIRGILAWLGPCKRTQAAHSMHLYFSFTPEGDAAAITYDASDALAAFANVWFELIARIEGDPWRRSDAVIKGLRETLGDTFLRS